jgi:hypothetical protein
MLLHSLSLLAWMCEWNFVLAISIYLSLSMHLAMESMNESEVLCHGGVVSKYHCIPCSHHTLLLMPLTTHESQSLQIGKIKIIIDIEFFMFNKMQVVLLEH